MQELTFLLLLEKCPSVSPWALHPAILTIWYHSEWENNATWHGPVKLVSTGHVQWRTTSTWTWAYLLQDNTPKQPTVNCIHWKMYVPNLRFTANHSHNSLVVAINSLRWHQEVAPHIYLSQNHDVTFKRIFCISPWFQTHDRPRTIYLKLMNHRFLKILKKKTQEDEVVNLVYSITQVC